MITGGANPIVSAGIAGLHALFAERSVTPIETLGVFLDRIDRLNGSLNIVVHRNDENAARAAQESAARWANGAALGPLDGCPILVKANVAVADLPWTGALTHHRARVSTQDASVVSRLREAGAIVIGLANMHEAAFGATTTSPLYGPCANPLAPDHTPGGSSGGSAAGVAAGFCVGAIGTDTMGSVRIPSAYCGVSGFKPSAGRLSRQGVVSLSFTLDHVGLHARSAADIAALFAATRGYDAADARSIATVDAPPRTSLRLGVLAQDWRALSEPAVSDAFELAIQQLSAHVPICRVDGTFDFARARRSGLLLCEAELAVSEPEAVASSADLSPMLQSMMTFGRAQSAIKLAQCYHYVDAARLAARAMFADLDILLLPTAPQTAFPRDQSAPANQADFTAFANFAGLPAFTTPIYSKGSALPAGLQILGPEGEDAQVLAAAAMIEAILNDGEA